jgi:hypothetical protein
VPFIGLLAINLSMAKEQQKQCLAGTNKGQMGGDILIFTDWHKRINHFYVWPI